MFLEDEGREGLAVNSCFDMVADSALISSVAAPGHVLKCLFR